MLFTTSYLNQPRIFVYGLDSDTRAADPGYVSPDSELRPLYFNAVVKILESHPAATTNSPRQPNEANSLPIRPSLGSRTYPREPARTDPIPQGRL